MSLNSKNSPFEICEWKLNVRTLSEANLTGEHWSKKHKRHMVQKTLIRLFFAKEKPKVELPCIVVLTRVAPRTMDSDNLSSSFKWIRDTIGAELTGIIRAGMGDGDSRITWHYEQEKGNPKEYAIKIQFIPA